MRKTARTPGQIAEERLIHERSRHERPSRAEMVASGDIDLEESTTVADRIAMRRAVLAMKAESGRCLAQVGHHGARLVQAGERPELESHRQHPRPLCEGSRQGDPLLDRRRTGVTRMKLDMDLARQILTKLEDDLD